MLKKYPLGQRSRNYLISSCFINVPSDPPRFLIYPFSEKNLRQTLVEFDSVSPFSIHRRSEGTETRRSFIASGVSRARRNPRLARVCVSGKKEREVLDSRMSGNRGEFNNPSSAQLFGMRWSWTRCKRTYVRLSSGSLCRGCVYVRRCAELELIRKR